MDNIEMYRSARNSGRLCKTLVTTLLLLTPVVAPGAETLQLSVPDSVSNNLPGLVERILRTLRSTGYHIEVMNIPNKRSIDMLIRGKVAIEILRNPEVAGKFPNLAVIQPPVLSLSFGMVTSGKTPQYCDVSEKDFERMSVAGVLGMNIHADYYYPKFSHSTELSDVSSALEFVALRRANVIFLPDFVLKRLPQELRASLLVCPSHRTTFRFNTHIHRDYLWAKEKIEAAYRKEFGTDGE
jgi:hypothetical protein